MEPISPLYTADLFPPLYRELDALLRTLSAEDWERPTLAGKWLVRDVVAHLLHGDLRKLAAYRDAHLLPPPEPITSQAELVQFINGLNDQFIGPARILSPRLLRELLSFTGPMICELMASLPPHGSSLFAVGWAGEQESENWLDTGREYTERWHHQMQIRAAAGVPGLLERRWLFPLLDLSMRSLPVAYGHTVAARGTAVVIIVRGDGGGAWSLVREELCWTLYRGQPASPATTLTLDGEHAWQLFFNALPDADARDHVQVAGEAALAEPFLGARAVMV
jgi:uncharacterized protein (TIGR03083 family)